MKKCRNYILVTLFLRLKNVLKVDFKIKIAIINKQKSSSLQLDRIYTIFIFLIIKKYLNFGIRITHHILKKIPI